MQSPRSEAGGSLVARPPAPASLVLRVAALGVAVVLGALAVTLLAHPASRWLPGSLVFSGALLAGAVVARVALPASFRDRGVAIAAVASAGAAPFVAFCCDQARSISDPSASCATAWARRCPG